MRVDPSGIIATASSTETVFIFEIQPNQTEASMDDDRTITSTEIKLVEGECDSNYEEAKSRPRARSSVKVTTKKLSMQGVWLEPFVEEIKWFE